MKVTGRAIEALPARKGISQRTGEEWITREYVIETQEQYPKKIVFEVYGRDNLEKFNIRKNDIITVHFDINAREYKGRWFNSIRAFKVEHGAETVQEAPAAPTTATTPSQQSATPVQQPQPEQDADENLPF